MSHPTPSGRLRSSRFALSFFIVTNYPLTGPSSTRPGEGS